MQACFVKTLGNDFLVIENGMIFQLDKETIRQALSSNNDFSDWDTTEKFENLNLNKVVKRFEEDLEAKVVAKVDDAQGILWSAKNFDSFVGSYGIAIS